MLGTLECCLSSDARSATCVMNFNRRTQHACQDRQIFTSYQHNSPCKSVAVQVKLVVKNGGHNKAPEGVRNIAGSYTHEHLVPIARRPKTPTPRR